MKKTIISDVKIECDPPRVPFYIKRNGQEAISDYYESWIKDFNEFIRDHRSQDPVSLFVEREYQDICSYCGSDWNEDENGLPLCCDQAEKEYKEAHKINT